MKEHELLKRALDGLKHFGSRDVALLNDIHAYLCDTECTSQPEAQGEQLYTWRQVVKAAEIAKDACKNATGLHQRIDMFINATQIAHDVCGTDGTTPTPCPECAKKEEQIAELIGRPIPLTKWQQMEQKLASAQARIAELELDLQYDWQATASQLRDQLAASQLHSKQLREALDQIKWNRKPGGSPTKYEYAVECIAVRALSLPHDTAALDKYVAEKLAEVVRERDEYRVGANAWHRAQERCVELSVQLTAARAEIEALRKALITYGLHKLHCNYVENREDGFFGKSTGKCDCGFEAALAAARKGEEE